MPQSAIAGVAPAEMRIRRLLAGLDLESERCCPFCRTRLIGAVTICPGCAEDLTELLALPALHESFYREALERYRTGDLDAALESAELCLLLRPADLDALRLVAGLSALLGQPGDARRYVDRGRRLAADDPDMAALSDAIAALQNASKVDRSGRPAALIRTGSADGGKRRAGDAVGSAWRLLAAGALAGVGFSTLAHWIAGRMRR